MMLVLMQAMMLHMLLALWLMLLCRWCGRFTRQSAADRISVDVTASAVAAAVAAAVVVMIRVLVQFTFDCVRFQAGRHIGQVDNICCCRTR